MRRLLALPAALLVALVATGGAAAHQGNPNMESVVRSVTPRVDGLRLDVLNRDDRFELVNRTGQPVVVFGYEGEPYARLLPDGTVQVNRRSPAYYLNSERDGSVDVPASATSRARPSWSTLDKTHTFEWHDHRMHYMGKGVPAQVHDTAQRQKVFDYTIPIRVGAQKGAIAGTLWWTPQQDGGPPAAAIGAFAALLLAGAAWAAIVRRRRREGRDDEAGDGDRSDGDRAPAEAW